MVLLNPVTYTGIHEGVRIHISTYMICIVSKAINFTISQFTYLLTETSLLMLHYTVLLKFRHHACNKLY